jgi:hypothetical protein
VSTIEEGHRTGVDFLLRGQKSLPFCIWKHVLYITPSKKEIPRFWTSVIDTAHNFVKAAASLLLSLFLYSK